MNKRYLGVIMALFALVFVVSTSYGEDLDAKDKKAGRQALAKTAGTPRYQILNINNLSTWYGANGNGNFPPSRTGDGLYFPRGTGSAVYEDGIMWGGKVYINDPRGNPNPSPGPVNANQWFRVGGNEYEQGNQEGWIIGFGKDGQAADLNLDAVRAYRIRRDWLTMSKEELEKDAAEFNEISTSSVTNVQTEDVKNKYTKDWDEWPVAYGAPYVERNGVAGYQKPPAFNLDPAKGKVFTADSLISGKYDEPGVAGADPNSPADQVIYTVYNDLNRANTTTLYGSEPMGIEGQVTLWGYKRTDALGNIYFKRVRLINQGGCVIDTLGNKGSFFVDSMYVAQWSDPDLGNAGDDLIGCDTNLSLGYIYNGNAVDLEYRQFNLPPPAAGYDFLAGPLVPAPGDSGVYGLQRVYDRKNLGMTSFAFFSAGAAISDPRPRTWSTGSFRWYQMLKGFAPIGSVGSGNAFYPFPPGDSPGKFPLAGDPITRRGFIDGLGTDYSFPPGDRRLIMNTGPFFLAPRDTQEIVVGTVVGLGSDRLSSIAVMKFNDRFVQNTYDALFQVPRPPAAPDAKVAELDGEVTLEWASNRTRVADIETKISNPGAFRFEGYNVYQLPSRGSRLSEGKLVATFDTEDDPTVVLDEQFDLKSGQILKVPVFFGSNSAIQRRFSFKKDYIRDINKIYNGQEYYLVVTAYSVSTIPGYLPAALESAPIVLTVRPRLPFGMIMHAKYADTVAVVHSPGTSDGKVAPIVIDPTKITGDTYRVSFKVDPNDPASFLWTLKNVTKNQDLLVDQTNQADNETHTVLDGLLMKVVGPPVAINTWEFEGGTRWFTGVDWGGAQFFGGMDLGANFFGSNITPDKYVTVEVRFRTNKDGQRAYRYLRGGTPNYGYQDYEPQHFTVWNVTANPPRQINAAYVEQSGRAAANKEWGPTTSNADREYLFILNSNYSDTPDPYYTSRTILGQAGEFDALYALWPLLRGSRTAPQWADGQIFRIIPNFANTDKDVFTFNTGPYAADRGTELEKASANKVGVFPNPYYAYNPAETNRFQRFVTFNNLPGNATIRIFTLSGQTVKVLKKVAGDNTGQFFRWDLTNTYGFPVASGIYIAHVDMPDLGMSKVLKVAIIQEQEILDTY